MADRSPLMYRGIDVVHRDGAEYFVHFWLTETGARSGHTIEYSAEEQRQQLRELGHDECEIDEWLASAREHAERRRAEVAAARLSHSFPQAMDEEVALLRVDAAAGLMLARTALLEAEGSPGRRRHVDQARAALKAVGAVTRRVSLDAQDAQRLRATLKELSGLLQELETPRRGRGAVTVGELRALLADLPDDMIVAVDAQEDGLTIERVRVRRTATKWTAPPQHRFEGELMEPGRANRDWPDGPEVLLISRRDEDE